MVSLSLNELKLFPKITCIKGYESMSEDKLLSALNKSEPVKTIRETKKENRDEDKIFRDLRFLFDPEKDLYEPKKTASAFNNNYVQYDTDVIRSYLSDIINNCKVQGKWRIHSGNKITDHKTQAEWKIHSTMAIDFISSKDYKDSKDSEDSDGTPVLHFKSDNIEIMTSSETHEIIEELFESLLQRYQEGLEESIKGSNFIFDSVDSLY